MLHLRATLKCSAGVALKSNPEVFIAPRRKSGKRGDPSLSKPGRTSPEVKNISGPTKKTRPNYVLQISIFAAGLVASAVDCYVRGFLFESSILSLLKHACGEQQPVPIKRLAGVALEVNLREHTSHMPPQSLNKVARSGFESQRRRHQKSKTGVPVAQ